MLFPAWCAWPLRPYKGLAPLDIPKKSLCNNGVNRWCLGCELLKKDAWHLQSKHMILSTSMGVKRFIVHEGGCRPTYLYWQQPSRAWEMSASQPAIFLGQKSRRLRTGLNPHLGSKDTTGLLRQVEKHAIQAAVSIGNYVSWLEWHVKYDSFLQPIERDHLIFTGRVVKV